MLATLFDVPQEDRHKLIYWSDTVENIGNPDVFETPQEAFQELGNALNILTRFGKSARAL